jgi:hypothetical protein
MLFLFKFVLYYLQVNQLTIITTIEHVLIFRVTDTIDAGNADNIDITVDGGKPYQQKVQRTLNTLASQIQAAPSEPSDSTPPPPPPITGWKKFPGHSVPKDFNYGQIYNYIERSAKFFSVSELGNGIDSDDDDGLDYSTGKSLKRGRQYFASRNVCSHHMKDAVSKEHYYLKCKVMSSYKAENMHCVMVTISTHNSQIVDASCDCKCSAMGRCSHVAALLLALEDYTLVFGHEPVACTSKLKSWNQGRKTKKDPGPVHQATYNKKIKVDKIEHNTLPIECQTEAYKKEFCNKFIADLPTTGNFSMWERALRIDYSDYELTPDEIENLKAKTDAFVINVYAKAHQFTMQHMVPGTTLQSDCSEWHTQRWWRLTSSNCKAIATAKSPRQKDDILQKNLWGINTPKTRAMVYGIQHEEHARKDYETVITKDAPASKVGNTGLWVNPKYPELGASPDGLVYDDVTHAWGLLEIKCPQVIENVYPLELEKISDTQRSQFCCSKRGDKLHLKRCHQYYFQVQMALGITELPWCDFVIWSKKGISIERIFADTTFWKATCVKLQKFYCQVYVPEFFEMRVPRRLHSIQLNLSGDD